MSSKKCNITAFLPDLITSFFLLWFFTLIVLIRQNIIVENEEEPSNLVKNYQKLIQQNMEPDNFQDKDQPFTFKKFKHDHETQDDQLEKKKLLNSSDFQVKIERFPKKQASYKNFDDLFDIKIFTPRTSFNKTLLETYGLYSAECFLNSSEGKLGDLGTGYKMPEILPDKIKNQFNEGWKKNYFNQYLSDQISINRRLKDYRTDWCKKENKLSKNLPQTAVVICFHNEAFSVLARTIYSVLTRSPPHLIKEIILVDDFSIMTHLKDPLEEYFRPIEKIKIIRASRREGLIRARLIGLTHVTAPVVTYLDSHCECTEGWLEPLLDRIARNSSTVVVPLIDVVDPKTFEYHSSDANEFIGGFDWDLTFNWFSISEREKKKHSSIYEPMHSPTMAGGLFAINVDFFKKLGTYDPGFEIWGGENLELSFKIWMCGGTLESISCSHVGHIFRDNAPYSSGKPGENLMLKNNYRLAKVWLDEFAQYYYDRIGNEKVNFGDVQDRKSIRERLQCKSFKWYLDNVFPELFRPNQAMGRGSISNPKTNLCLDSPASGENMEVTVYRCHHDGGNQYWLYSKAGEIRRDNDCLDISESDLQVNSCHGEGGNQKWNYVKDSGQLIHAGTRKCLEVNQEKNSLSLQKCDVKNVCQKWEFQYLNKTSNTES